MYYLPQRELVSVIRRGSHLPDVLVVPEVGGDGVPEGATVHHVFFAPERMAFGVVLEHPLFPECDGLFPQIGGDLRVRERCFPVVKGVATNWNLFNVEQLEAMRDDITRELERRGAGCDTPTVRVVEVNPGESWQGVPMIHGESHRPTIVDRLRAACKGCGAIPGKDGIIDHGESCSQQGNP